MRAPPTRRCFAARLRAPWLLGLWLWLWLLLGTALTARHARAQPSAEPPAPAPESPAAPQPQAPATPPAPESPAAPSPQAPITPPAPEPLVAPRLLEGGELELPEGVQAPDGVEAVLAIDAEGRVTEVELATSLGPDADALVTQAAYALRFEPARRGERPIAARVRFRFEVARAGSPTPASPHGPDGSAAPAPSTVPGLATDSAQPEPDFEALDQAEESAGLGATARVEKTPPGAASRVKLRGAELTMIPGTFGEPLRVVATLPGVVRSPFGLGFFVVRGAAFQNTGFLVDGFAVPLLYHLGAGPAILSSRLVDQLDFYPGGYPVAFGRFNAGVISLRTAPPPTDRVQLELEVDLLRASGLAIVPIGEGKGSVAVAFRRSYYELILPLVTDDVSLAYTDYQLRLDYRFDRRLRLSVFFFGSRDSFQAAQSTGAGATTGSSAGGLEYRFDQVIVSLEHRTAPELTLRWSGTFGPSGVDLLGESTGDGAIGTNTNALRLGQRLEAIYAPNEDLQTTLGFEESIFLYDFRGSAPSFAELPGIPAPSFTGETIAIEDQLSELAFAPYLEQVLRPGRFEITIGLRGEYLRYGDVSTWLFDPRTVVRFTLAEGVKLKAATGLFAQPPLPFQLTRDFANPRLRPNRAWQSSIGTEIELPESFEIDQSFFYSAMWQLTRPTGRVEVDAEGNTFRPFFDDDGRGRAYGLELLVRRRVEQGLFGWLSYTLSRSERYLEGGETIVFNFDQTHVLNFALSYAIDGWSFGGRFILATGRPVQDVLDRDGNAAVYDADEDDYNPDSRGRRTRLPTFHQLDVRVDRAWTLGPVKGSVFLDIINVYNARNSEGYQYEYDFTRRGRLPGLPFLPTIGVKGVL